MGSVQQEEGDGVGQERDSLRRVPVSVLTGFLGSGKTTLLNWILKETHGLKIAIIENEYGEVNVDEQLVSNKQNTRDVIISMSNGCVCCTMRGDLVGALQQLRDHETDFDAIIIETTGLADPGPVLQSFLVDEDVRSYAAVDAVITVVDAQHIEQHLDETKEDGAVNEALEQVAFADRLILNKTDLVAEDVLARVERRLLDVNATATIIRSQLTKSNVPLESILGLDAFNLEKALEVDPHFLTAKEQMRVRGSDGAADHSHDREDSTSQGPDHSHDHGHGHEGECGAGCDHHSHGQSHDHKHDSAVSSVGIECGGDVHPGRLQSWIQNLMTSKGEDLYRYKGVLSVLGADEKFVFQGVHMMFGGGFSEDHLWAADETRLNRFVFIGKHLDKSALIAGFKECLSGEDDKPLRFAVGDAVECAMPDGYAAGRVIKLWDSGHPYRVQLDSGTEVWGPVDEDRFIRAKP